jgi:hypothetical protein
VGKYSDEPQFVETQALIAALNGDDEELERLVREMNRTERGELLDACHMVENTVDMIQRGSNRI